MKKTDITDITIKIRETVEKHRIAPGQYARYLWQDARGSREMGCNPYGCADAANILYSVGAFPKDRGEREAFVHTIRAMQSEDGLFHEHTHHPIHTTAHCIAALELFDAVPEHPCTALLQYLDIDQLYGLLEGLDWENNPWRDSHQGAGIYVAMNLTGKAGRDWNQAYFDWFLKNTDPETGFWAGKDSQTEKLAPLYQYMAGGFHYMFNHEYAHMPLRYPEKVIDSCLSMYQETGGLPANFGKKADFLEIDWVYCLSRASRQTPHRYWEIREALEDFAEKQISWWLQADWDRDETINDLHMLFGGVCTLAELQSTLRGQMPSDVPLKLVLDRRPFI